MNLRERFHEVMNFNPGIPAPKWEFGYWGETINHWYAAGLPRNHYAAVPDRITTPTASLYTAAWRVLKNDQCLPAGFPVMAGGLYWPSQGFSLDSDVKDYFGMDYTQRMVDVNMLFDPMFEPQTIREDEKFLEYIDIDGARRIFAKHEATIPSGLEWPVKDWDSWNTLKRERIRLDDIATRFPANWSAQVAEYRNRDYPLAIGGYPHGLFGTLAHLMGYENLFCAYYTDSELIHDILNTFTELWMRVYEQILSEVEVDHLHFWEDVSAGKGSMVSPKIVEEFMLPYYRRIIDFVKARGVKTIFVDTDGDCYQLIPLFMSAGVTGMYPFETHCGMDIVKVRQMYPTLQISGGISKSEIAKGPARIDEILKPVAEVLKTGGYIPFGDHFIPPDVPWECFKYYREKLNALIDSCAN